MENLVFDFNALIANASSPMSVVLVLLYLGSILKAYDKIENRHIAPILTVVGIGLVALINVYPILGSYVMQGVIVSWVASGGYSQLKNMTNKRTEQP